MSKRINHPHHYKAGKLECIDVMEDVFGKQVVLNFCISNAFKYIYRCMNKHNTPIDDMRKAIWYLNKYIEKGENQMLTLYSTDCPKCKVLKSKLLNKGIDFIEITSVGQMISAKITHVPMLKVGDELLSYSEAIKWINEQGGN